MAVGTRGKWIVLSMALAAGTRSGIAAAGISVGSLEYGREASLAVPTLGGGALIALALLLAVIGYRMLRSEHYRGANLMVAAAAASALAAGGGGIKLISDAYALTPATIHEMEDNSGILNVNVGYNEYVNISGAPKLVLDINLDEGCYTTVNGGGPGPLASAEVVAQLNGGGVGECRDDPPTVVPAPGFCSLQVFCEN